MNKFTSVAEAFNAYRGKSIEEMESRAAEIDRLIDSDPTVDIESLNVELRGIKEARENAELRSCGFKSVSVMDMTGNVQKRNDGDVLSSKEYRSAFFKNLLGQTLTAEERSAFTLAQKNIERRTDVFNAASDSVAVLPTETLNEVIAKARTIGGLMGEVRAFSVPTKISIPVGTPATKAAWHTEGADVAGEKITTAAVSFDGYEIMKVFSLSAKTRTMSIAAFESYLVDELTNCVMDCIGDALVNGTGSNQGTGIEKITWTADSNLHAVTGDLQYADVVKTVALLKRGYAQGAKWAMNNATLYNCFYGMVDTTGRPVFIADPKNEGIGKILGFDVIVDDYIADGAAYLGNFAKYMGYNMPEGIVVDVSRESSFKKGLIDYRALAIADCKPIVNEAFVKLTVTAE